MLGISKHVAKSEFQTFWTELRNQGSKRANYLTSSNIVAALLDIHVEFELTLLNSVIHNEIFAQVLNKLNFTVVFMLSWEETWDHDKP